MGILELDRENTENSKIILPAQKRGFLDFNTMDKLSNNKDFQSFLEVVAEVISNEDREKSLVLCFS